MHERALRTILLIQAIEETDQNGEVLPMADRVQATRAIEEDSPLGDGSSAVDAQVQAPLSSADEWFLTRRAEALLANLRTRSPGVDHVLAVAGGATWLDRATLAVAFAVGVVLATLDADRRINILGLPLIGLIAWNVFAYVALISATLHVHPERVRPRRWRGSLYARWVRARIEALVGHSTRFNAPLAPGLRRFAADWWDIAQPLFIVRARRLLHFAAACVALGLIAGFCVRGFVLRYPAGWHSTFLGPESAHALLIALYGPASALSGIAIPSAQEIAALRWTSPTGGAGAGEWVRLIAWTAMLYIVVPRLLAALASTLELWRLSRRLTIPAALCGYMGVLLVRAHAETT